MLDSEIDDLCKQIMDNSVKVAFNKQRSDIEFTLAVNSINTILEYLSDCRKCNER